MKETSLLFTPENYDKVVRGLKTQTRRIVRLTDSGRVKLSRSPKNWHLDDPNAVKACPFGTVGDRLFVKEGLETEDGFTVRYRRDKAVVHHHPWRWERSYLSPLHMPMWAARLWLELTNVRVERVQEITETDAISEGCVDAYGPDFHVGAFRKLWDTIHGPGAFERNDWVWVLSYRKVEP